MLKMVLMWKALFLNSDYRKIDPVYALPTDIVQELNLVGQVMSTGEDELDERLQMYQILES